MHKMIITWVILVFGLVGTLTYIGFRYIDSVKEYQLLETDMVEAAGVYYEISNIDLRNGESIKITSDQLIETKTISTMDIKDDKCVGYVLIKRKSNKNDYNAYIKCGEYETLDYEE